MHVLITGASGFIGRHAADALEAAGHRVTRKVRPDIDFRRDVDADRWVAHVRGVDVVVNAVGVFASASDDAMHDVHVRAPIALFEACAREGVRVVQVSALGADEHATSRFHRSKRAADDHLRATHRDAVVLQPSLVYGRGGASASMLGTLASLPLVPLPGDGSQRIQPVHVDDVAAAIVDVVDRPGDAPTTVPLVGPRALTLRDYLQALRTALGGARAIFVPVPRAWVHAAVLLGAALRSPWASDEALAMLERGNTADPSALATLLGREPRPVEAFVDPSERDEAGRAARLPWTLGPLRLSLAAVWLATAAVTLFAYPMDASVAMVERTGLHGPLAVAAVYAGAVVDAAFGVATLVVRRARWLWIAQAAVTLAYSAIIAVALPEYLVHPFGPLTKNLPILAVLAMLYAMERR